LLVFKKLQERIFMLLQCGVWIVIVLEAAALHHDFTECARHATAIGKGQTLNIE
jgi:hypothetical protein